MTLKSRCSINKATRIFWSNWYLFQYGTEVVPPGVTAQTSPQMETPLLSCFLPGFHSAFHLHLGVEYLHRAATLASGLHRNCPKLAIKEGSVISESMLAACKGWSRRDPLWAVSMLRVQEQVRMALQRLWLVLPLGTRQPVQ